MTILIEKKKPKKDVVWDLSLFFQVHATQWMFQNWNLIEAHEGIPGFHSESSTLPVQSAHDQASSVQRNSRPGQWSIAEPRHTTIVFGSFHYLHTNVRATPSKAFHAQLCGQSAVESRFQRATGITASPHDRWPSVRLSHVVILKGISSRG